MSRALAVNEDRSLQFMLEEKYVQPMALKDRKDGDSEQLERVRSYNKKLEKEVTEFRAMSAENASEFIGMLPQFETLKKMCITDSKGQHKLNRNCARAIEEGAAVKAVNTVQAEVTETSIWDKI